MKHLRRLSALLLCALLILSVARADGMRFRLKADVNADTCPQDVRQLMEGMALLLNAAVLEGEFQSDGSTFMLDASLLLGNSCTDIQVYGLDSHWGVRSNLLGDQELMVNCAALLPFGQKARDHLDLPLDAAALLIPYTHTHALSAAKAVLAPLLPEDNGKWKISRGELDSIITELMRLCDEDPALSRYLEATGLYHTAKRYGEAYFTIPELLLPSLTVKRTDTQLIWSSGLLTLMTIEQLPDRMSLDFSIPTAASISFSVSNDGKMLTGSLEVDLSSIRAVGSFSMPSRLTNEGGAIGLSLTASAPRLPDGGITLLVSGETHGNEVTLRQLDPVSGDAVLTITGTLIPVASDALPAFSPEDLTGFNVLSANSESLQAFLSDVKWPLLEGVLSIVAAAPAQAVQTLMDYAEDSGLLDLLTESLISRPGY